MILYLIYLAITLCTVFLMAGTSMSVGGKNFLIPEDTYEEGESWYGKYFKFKKPVKHLDHFEFKNVAHVAGMGKGKSTDIRGEVDFLNKSFGEDDVGVLQTDMVEVAVNEAEYKPILAFIIDDAVNANDSRLSGGVDRALATQRYFMLRHDLKVRFPDRGGLVFVDWGYQHLTAIDVRFRSLCDVLWFKSAQRDSNIKRLINNKLGWSLLQQMSRAILFNDWSVRQISVGTTEANDTLVLHMPYIAESAIKIPYISGETNRQQYYNFLYQTFNEQPIGLLAGKKSTQLGFFEQIRKDDPRYNRLHIARDELDNIINLSLYEKRKELAHYKLCGGDDDSSDNDTEASCSKDEDLEEASAPSLSPMAKPLPPGVSVKDVIYSLYAMGKADVPTLAKTYRKSERTIYRWIREITA